MTLQCSYVKKCCFIFIDTRQSDSGPENVVDLSAADDSDTEMVDLTETPQKKEVNSNLRNSEYSTSFVRHIHLCH